ncbi:MAG: 3'-5' exonuclease [Verrucomicrobiota bacterium]
MKSYSGPVSLPCKEEEIHAAVEDLKGSSVLGFDTETRPTFKKGQHYLPSLVQLAGKQSVYLFQIKQCEVIDPLFELMEQEGVVKTGIALSRDLSDLKGIREFEPRGFVDSASIASSLQFEKTGLRNLCGMLLGFRISKKAQVSNWARQELTAEQIRYAATDAWVSREIYLAMRSEFPEKFSDEKEGRVAT